MMPIAHQQNWRVLLDAQVYAKLQTPFAWGVHDCALFAADVVRATTGVDLAADLRGYRTAREALRIIRARGGLRSIASRALGQPLAPSHACTGDVALVPTCAQGRRHALAVCITADKAAAPGRAGLQIVPMARALCVWRVG